MNERCRPMLAVPGQPFDSADYLFEIKWNGIRALAARHTSGWDLWGRALADYRSRYPEMAVLAALPPGTILDGELVVFSKGLPDLEAILARHHLSNSGRIRHASRYQPVSYVIFDLLSYQGHSLLSEPLQRRRALLEGLLARWQQPTLQYSEGVVGPGRVFFEQAVRHGQEGIIAKQLGSKYLPGRRTGRWLKIKPARSVPCVVLGWQPGRWGVRSLLVAAVWDGRLRYVANVRTGFTMEERHWLPSILVGLGRARPVVACPHQGLWLEPEVFCQVSYLDWTRAGRLRGASFRGMLTAAGLPLASGLGGLAPAKGACR
jgi:bifunctional non-homologous end joining protein LigD